MRYTLLVALCVLAFCGVELAVAQDRSLDPIIAAWKERQASIKSFDIKWSETHVRIVRADTDDPFGAKGPAEE